MVRKKTLKKRKPLSFVKDSKVSSLQDWNPTAELLDEKSLAQALFLCLKDEDLESFKEILSAHLDAKVKTRLAKENGLSTRTMFEALSKEGNPSLKTLSKLIKLACVA